MLTLTKDNFKEQVLEADIPVLVDFWAPWCGPCKMQNPILAEFAKNIEGRAKVGKVNVDENQDLSSQYGVMSIPTLIWFKKGKVVLQMVGVQDKEKLEKEIDKISK